MPTLAKGIPSNKNHQKTEILIDSKVSPVGFWAFVPYETMVAQDASDFEGRCVIQGVCVKYTSTARPLMFQESGTS